MKKSTLIYKITAVTLILLLLEGCAAAVVAGGATGAAVAYDRRTTGALIEDQSIELKAGQSLSKDKEIKDTAHINVTSYNGVVLVTGEAPTGELKERIINIVRNIPKVTQVYDELAVAAPSALVSRSSDSLITSKVKTRLLTLDNFDGARAKVVTERGIVYLMGLLTREESDRVTEAARQVGGVQKVVKLFQYID